VKQKAKRVGKYTGFKPGYKKAIVTLSEGSIDIFGEDAE
jgi:large subunit ribosomal protein L23